MSKHRLWKIIYSWFLPLYPLYWPERFSSRESYNENLGLVDQSWNPWGFSKKKKKKISSINGDDTNLGFDRRQRNSKRIKKIKQAKISDIYRCLY